MSGRVTVCLVKPGKGETVRYEGVVLRQSERHLLVHARWTLPKLELPHLAFERGDHFFEHYFFDAHFNIYEVRAPGGKLKGWYCNVCRPATLAGGVLRSEDLELDLVVSQDGRFRVLDEDAFAARDYDAATRAAARSALEALLEGLAARQPPFDGSDERLSLTALR